MNEFKKVENYITLLNEQLPKINNYLLNNEKFDHNIVGDKLFEFRKILMKINLLLANLQIKYKDNDNIQEKINFYKTRTNFFNKSMNIIDKYNSALDRKGQTKSLKLLTMVNMIALPLAIITGYFGMNFKSMGNPMGSKGILSHKHGQKIVLALFVISIIVMIILTHFFLT